MITHRVLTKKHKAVALVREAAESRSGQVRALTTRQNIVYRELPGDRSYLAKQRGGLMPAADRHPGDRERRWSEGTVWTTDRLRPEGLTKTRRESIEDRAEL